MKRVAIASLYHKPNTLAMKRNAELNARPRAVVRLVNTIDPGSPGATSIDVATFPYRHAQRPVWLVDPDFEWTEAGVS